MTKSKESKKDNDFQGFRNYENNLFQEQVEKNLLHDA